MMSLTQQTNILTPVTMYGDKGFLDWLVRLQPFHSETGKPPMSANQFYWQARLSFECGLRVSESLHLRKQDFDLDHRILTLIDPKTAKGSKQFTSILPYSISKLEKFLNSFKEDENPFPTTRGTIWRYYKNCSTIAGMDIFTIRETQVIKGAWTHMMRNSCSRMYESAGASESLINKKLRWKPNTMQQRYNRVEIADVLEFDKIHFSNLARQIHGDVA